LIRASHVSLVDNVAASSSTWMTRDRTTHTPACACPARNSAHWVSSSTSLPGASPAVPLVRMPSNVSPPYMIVGTVSTMTPATNLASRDSCISQPLLFGAAPDEAYPRNSTRQTKSTKAPQPSTLSTVWSRAHAARRLLAGGGV